MAVIALDRDGVINVDSKDYIKSAAEWQPIPGSIEAIAQLCRKGYDIYIATNQAGLARGLFQMSDLEAMHSKLVQLVEAAGGKINGIMFCPHHPDEQCQCRKPRTGLLQQIEAHSRESMQNQYFVGDSSKDIQAARAIKAIPVLVLTGNGTDTREKLEDPVQTFTNLAAFADFVPDLRQP
jgi:D-glycero-D-manno-heptose 1,7-bisphosphate phosphatase